MQSLIANTFLSQERHTPPCKPVPFYEIHLHLDLTVNESVNDLVCARLVKHVHQPESGKNLDDVEVDFWLYQCMLKG